jgi:3-phosphoshikimate 1-carboxyvinyltransferase
MSAPYARHEVHVELAPNQTSWPYVEMTLRLMDQFGHTPELERDPLTREPKLIVIPKGCYAPTQYDVEPDASNASYFLALAAVHPGSRVLVQGLSETSLQGDARYGRVLERAGVKIERLPEGIRATGPDRLAPIDVDLSDMPDLAQTTAVVALYADGPSVLRGLHTLRVKETDRLAALDQELTRLGATIKIEDECLYITPPASIRPTRIQTYDDHRMAMSFAIAATRSPGVVIADAECVNKTYPNYFDDLRSLIAQ